MLNHPIGSVKADDVDSRGEMPPNNTIYISNLNEKVPI